MLGRMITDRKEEKPGIIAIVTVVVIKRLEELLINYTINLSST